MSFESCIILLLTESSWLINIEHSFQWILKASYLCFSKVAIFQAKFLKAVKIIELMAFQKCNEIWYNAILTYQIVSLPEFMHTNQGLQNRCLWLFYLLVNFLVFEKNHDGISFMPLLQHHIFHTLCEKIRVASSTIDVRICNQRVRTILVNGCYHTKIRCNFSFVPSVTLPIWPKVESKFCTGTWVSIPTHTPRGVVSQAILNLFKFLCLFWDGWILNGFTWMWTPQCSITTHWEASW